jgi:hypothetical protein
MSHIGSTCSFVFSRGDSPQKTHIFGKLDNLLLPTTAATFEGLLNGHTFCEVSGLVYVAASADGYVVGEELEGDYF